MSDNLVEAFLYSATGRPVFDENAVSNISLFVEPDFILPSYPAEVKAGQIGASLVYNIFTKPYSAQIVVYPSPGSYKDAYNLLYQLAQNATLFSLVTRARIWKNLAIYGKLRDVATTDNYFTDKIEVNLRQTQFLAAAAKVPRNGKNGDRSRLGIQPTKGVKNG